MKKNIKNITLKFLCLCAFVFSLISCKEVSEDGNKPALNVKGDSIIVSFAVDEKAKYVNIFRREVKDFETSKFGDTINVGQVIPKKNQETAFTFEDTLICKGVDYQYCVRYCMGDYYYLSNWSDIRSNANAKFVNESEITPDIVSCHLEYDSATSSLVLEGDNNIDALKGGPALIFSYKDKETTVSRVFALPIKEDIKGSDAEKILKVGTPIDLRSLLTSDFFGKDITLEGFIGEDVVEGGPDDDGDGEVDIVYYEKVFWTLPAEIDVKEKVKDKDEYKTVDFINDFIKIEVETADNGHDYSSEGIENPISKNINSIDSQITSKEYFVSK
ncbi:MAG: hypothetical protein J6J67_03470 [Treponema sp.]|nr:hypothetical protein [Treponema sp.]